MKKCKQCGRKLPLDNFRKYSARGRGVYETKQGYYTICKDCESISNRARTAIANGNEKVTSRLTEHYKRLLDMGFPPVTAPAKQLLNWTKANDDDNDKLEDLLNKVAPAIEYTIEDHCRLVRERGYASFSEADEVHKKLAKRLKEAGLYEEINDLMDEWYMDED